VSEHLSVRVPIPGGAVIRPGETLRLTTKLEVRFTASGRPVILAAVAKAETSREAQP
jgi:hypothetical protein